MPIVLFGASKEERQAVPEAAAKLTAQRTGFVSDLVKLYRAGQRFGLRKAKNPARIHQAIVNLSAGVGILAAEIGKKNAMRVLRSSMKIANKHIAYVKAFESDPAELKRLGQAIHLAMPAAKRATVTNMTSLPVPGQLIDVDFGDGKLVRCQAMPPDGKACTVIATKQSRLIEGKVWRPAIAAEANRMARMETMKGTHVSGMFWLGALVVMSLGALLAINGAKMISQIKAAPAEITKIKGSLNREENMDGVEKAGRARPARSRRGRAILARKRPVPMPPMRRTPGQQPFDTNRYIRAAIDKTWKKYGFLSR